MRISKEEMMLREKHFQCVGNKIPPKSLFEHVKEIIKLNYLYYVKKEDVIITDRMYCPKKIMRYEYLYND